MALSAEMPTQPTHNNGHAPSALCAALAHLFYDPFSVDSEAVFAYTPAERDRLRRAGILRLVVTCLTVIQALWLPLVMSNHAPVHVIMPQVLAVLLGIFCLILNHSGRTTASGLLYVYGVIVLIGTAAISGYPMITVRTLLILCLLSAFIWLSGLVLPVWVIWPTAVLAAAISLCTVVLIPLSPALAHAEVTGEEPHGVIIGLLTTLYVLSATLSWVSARSAGAGVASILRAFEREQDMVALKDQFILTANHELRTPLAALYSNVELLSVLEDEASAEERKRIVQRALRSGDALLALLDAVLDASSVEEQAVRLTVRPVHLSTVVRDLVLTADVRAFGGLHSAREDEREDEREGSLERPLRLDISPDLYVLADEGRLRQVLVNLLSNALKYSGPGTPIAVTARRLRAHGRPTEGRPTGRERTVREPAAGQVRVSVQDAGLGVPPAEASKLFQRFVRLERDIGGTVRGTGVGLYLCRMFIEAMGGRIWVESSGVPGVGSMFSFTLPAAPQPGGASTQEEV